MDRDKLVDIQDMASDLALNSDALKALGCVFGDAFATDRDPEKLASAIRNRPEIFTHLWYLLFGLVCDLSTAAHKLDDALGAE